VVIDVAMPRHPWRLIAVHASWPLGAAVSRERAADFAAIAAAARAASLPVVVAGDFNVSPWSPHFEALLRAGTLRDAAAGRGWQPSWPTFLPPFGIQIDHALVSASVQVNSFGRGRIQGSDHRPILVDLVLP
jgi:endonuclease/exonuclease/phosphatase (EEP) superfamily protein YafD